MDLKCQYCEAELEADENYYGKTCPCPSCGENIKIPVLDDSSDYTLSSSTTLAKRACPFCNEKILTSVTKCTSCGKLLDEAVNLDAAPKGGIFRFLNIFKKNKYPRA